jgi:exonuclease III
VRLLSWNVAGRRTRLPEQVDAVAAATPDAVCLQEVTWNSLPLWREALAELGLEHTTTPLDEGRPPKPRRLAVLTASREPHEPIAIDGLPWPERAVHVAFGSFGLVNVHSPISPSPALAKVLTHEALYEHLKDRDRIVLAGDLNTPRRNLDDGTVLTFAHESNGALREERGERWAAAERALVQTLRLEHGWRDPFLDSGTAERTWTWKGDKGGWRLDHVLVKGVEVGAHAYAHDWRRAGLSDHSAVVADLRAP